MYPVAPISSGAQLSMKLLVDYGELYCGGRKLDPASTDYPVGYQGSPLGRRDMLGDSFTGIYDKNVNYSAQLTILPQITFASRLLN